MSVEFFDLKLNLWKPAPGVQARVFRIFAPQSFWLSDRAMFRLNAETFAWVVSKYKSMSADKRLVVKSRYLAIKAKARQLLTPKVFKEALFIGKTSLALRLPMPERPITEADYVRPLTDREREKLLGRFMPLPPILDPIESEVYPDYVVTHEVARRWFRLNKRRLRKLSTYAHLLKKHKRRKPKNPLRKTCRKPLDD